MNLCIFISVINFETLIKLYFINKLFVCLSSNKLVYLVYSVQVFIVNKLDLANSENIHTRSASHQPPSRPAPHPLANLSGYPHPKLLINFLI